SPPFPEGSITNKVQAHTNAPRPNPQDRNAAIPPGVVAVMHRMMASKQADRYRTPADLIADLANDRLFRQDLMPDLLTALSNESAGSRARPQSPAEDEEDWEQIFHRVRGGDQDESEFDFDSGATLSRKSEVETREVETEAKPSQRNAPAQKKKRKQAQAEQQA